MHSYYVVSKFLQHLEQGLFLISFESWQELRYRINLYFLMETMITMAEEAGEAIRAANNLCYHGGSIEDLQTELAQTGAMCIRVMAQLMAGRSSKDNGKRN